MSITGPVDITYVGFLLGHGGDALQMLELAKGMTSRGARVRIVVPAVPESETFKERCDGLGIDCERNEHLAVGVDGPHQRLGPALRLLRSIRSPIVHFHTGNTFLPLQVMVGLELARARPSFVTLQSPYETMAPGSARAKAWSALAGRRMAAVVSPSDHASGFQLRAGVAEHLVATVRNSIDVEAMAHGDPAVARAELGVEPDAPIVLFCSRLDPQKRPVEAVRIFAGVASQHPAAVLVFAGNGSEEDAVRDEAVRRGLDDRIRLVGYQTNVPSWLAAATVWILPTERENFSVAVLEALAAGCAVLSTSCPGNDEVLVHGENAVTFQVGDVDAATSGLRALLGQPDLRDRLASEARATARRFTADRMVDEYLALYRRNGPLPSHLETTGQAEGDPGPARTSASS